MSNPYWWGHQQCKLEQNQIQAKWGQPGQSDCIKKLALLNKAFELFYQARQKIDSCPSPEQAHEMRTELEKAAKIGDGFGVTDLKEAFEHVHKYGCWQDKNTKYYNPGNPSVPLWGQGEPLPDAPEGAVQFLHALQGRIRDMHSILEDHTNNANIFVRMSQKSAREWEWEEIGEALNKIEEGGQNAKKFMWWADIKFDDNMGRALNFVETLNRFHSEASRLAHFWVGFEQGGKSREDQVFKSLIGAAAGAANLVPVLGGFYSSAIKGIPQLKEWFEGIMIENDRKKFYDIFNHEMRGAPR